jgi:hypothetical protein
MTCFNGLFNRITDAFTNFSINSDSEQKPFPNESSDDEVHLMLGEADEMDPMLGEEDERSFIGTLPIADKTSLVVTDKIEPFMFLGEFGLMLFRDIDNMNKVKTYLNNSLPAQSLYKKALDELSAYHGCPEQKIQIKVVPHREASFGGSCNAQKRTIRVSAMKASNQIEFATVTLFELANMTLCNAFRALEKEVIHGKMTREDYGMKMEKTERNSLFIANEITVQSLTEASSDEERNFWSSMVNKSSRRLCRTIMDDGPLDQLLSPEKEEEIYLKYVQQQLHHTDHYYAAWDAMQKRVLRKKIGSLVKNPGSNSTTGSIGQIL